jgi:hypothetical protein
MNRLVLATVVLLTAPAMAHAACDGVDNCLGIYFDQGEWTDDCLEPVPFLPVHIYFVLKNCTFDAIGGFEFAWRYAPEPAPLPIVLSAWLPGPEPWIFDYDNIIYGSPQPIVTGGPTVLLDLTVLLLAPITADLQLGPSTPASLPGHGAINEWDNWANIVPLSFGGPVDVEGWTVDGVAQIGDCSTTVEAANWGTIKALFR